MKEERQMKVLLDVDTGVDDSIALLYALFNPEIEIVGISAVCGNVEAWLAAENTMKILDLAGAPDIPVAVGAEKPSCREWDGRVAFIHGKNGLGNVELPPSRRSTRDVDVSRFHMDLAEQYGGELMVITLGPLTNIARTIREYPGFVHKVKGLVMMGGTLTMRGNVSPVAEANVVARAAVLAELESVYREDVIYLKEHYVFTPNEDGTFTPIDCETRKRRKAEGKESKPLVN